MRIRKFVRAVEIDVEGAIGRECNVFGQLSVIKREIHQYRDRTNGRGAAPIGAARPMVASNDIANAATQKGLRRCTMFLS